MKFLVIGDPIAHSLSPAMQNAGFEFYHLGAPYDKRQVTLAELPAFAEYARKHLDGFNITVPHKNAILPFLDEITPEAELAGSVNTVAVRDGKLCGYSTDGYGLQKALESAFDCRLSGKAILFIGCGGAVQATACHLATLGVKAIYIVNRTEDKAEALAAKIHQIAPALTVKTAALSEADALRDFLHHADILVQGSSLGLKADDPAPFDLALLDGIKNLCVFDTIYKETKLLAAARSLHLSAAGGLPMLLYQGAKAFEIWLGRPAPVEVMKQKLEEAYHAALGH